MTNTVKAFQIKSVTEGKSWLTRSRMVKAASEAEALEIYRNFYPAEQTAVLTAIPVEIFHTSEKITVDSYPYGRLRATAFFNVEYKPKKGFRSVFQTINPKNGRLNAPKYGTYSPAEFCYKTQDGHVHWYGLGMNGADELNTAFHFMADFSEIFTPEQLRYVIGFAFMMVKVDAKATVIYGGLEWEKIKHFYEPAAANLSEMLKGEAGNWRSCIIDKAAIDAMKDPNFSPFKVTTYTTA